MDKARESLELTIFLFGIDNSTKSSELKSYLEKKTTGIRSVKLPDKKKSGYAFVQMESASSFKKLLSLKGLKLNGRQLQLVPYSSGSDLKKLQRKVNSKRIFISKIPSNWKDEDLLDLFGRFGKIENAYIIRRRKNNKSRGFGYAIFETEEAAARVASLGSVKTQETTLLVKMHEPKHKQAIKEEEGRPDSLKVESPGLKIQPETPFLKLKGQHTKPTKSSYHLVTGSYFHLESNIRINHSKNKNPRNRDKIFISGMKGNLTDSKFSWT